KKAAPIGAAWLINQSSSLRAEGRPASASAARARIVKAESRAMQSFDVVERRARDIRQRNLVHVHQHAAKIRHPVALFPRVEVQRILKPGASAADHADSQSVVCAKTFLRVHLVDHLDRGGRELNVRQRSGIDMLGRRLLSLLVPVMLDMKSFGHFCHFSYKPPARSAYASMMPFTNMLILWQ